MTKESPKERIAQLESALQYVIDRAWAANTDKAGKWINEFVDVAKKALGKEADE